MRILSVDNCVKYLRRCSCGNGFLSEDRKKNGCPDCDWIALFYRRINRKRDAALEAKAKRMRERIRTLMGK